MNLSPRNKVIATAVGAAVIVVVLIVVLIVPQFGKMADNQQQIDQANDEAQKAKTLLDQRREVKNAAAVTDATLTQLNNAVPENPELPSLIIELQDVAYASGVSLRAVVPGEPVQEEPAQFVAIPISIETWGTWADSVSFLQDLRKLSRQVRVVDFESLVLDESSAAEARIKMPPYYQVKMTSSLEVYVIPADSVGSSAVPAPAPAPAQ